MTLPAPLPPLIRFAGRIPIVVGVTGHRDLVESAPDAGAASPRRKVELALREILDQNPHTPVILLTALAEGADTLAAEVARSLAAEPRFQEPSGGSRIAYAVVLPMPLAACAADFSDPGHAARVSALSLEAIAQYEIPLKEGTNASTLPRDPLARQEQYQRLAAHLVQHSHVLLALWDGKQGKPGGTADVVQWFLEGVPADRQAGPQAVDVLRAGPGVKLVHIPVMRQGATTDGDLRVVGGTHPERERQVFAQMEEYNKDVHRILGNSGDQAASAREGLGLTPASDPPGGWIPASVLDPLLEAYAASDFLAQRNRDRRWRSTIYIFASALTSLLAFETYSHLFRGDPWSLAVYLAFFVLPFLVVIWARRRQIENKFLVYRSLAEALRVQIAWTGGGVRASVADNYQPLHDNEIAWVRHSLKGLAVLAGEPLDSRTAFPRERAAAIGWALRTWVQAQARWFAKKVSRLHAKSRCCRVIFLGCMGAGAAVAALLLVQELFPYLPEDMPHWIHGAILVLIVALIACGALAQAYGHQQAYETSARRYEAAGFIFLRAAERAEQGLRRGDPAGLDQAEAALRSLGREALTENVNWLLLSRDHELHVQTGG